MSSIYFPEVPVNYQSMSQEEIFQWLLREFERIAQTLQDELSVREFLPLSRPPEKYGEGSVVNFDVSGAAAIGIMGPGLYIFRNGEWRQLMEV